MIISHTRSSQKERILTQIDQLADTARSKVVGDPVRVKEYEVAQREAEAFQAANFTGTVPPSVLSWAEAKNWTPEQAALDILAASARWHGALYKIRDLRLKSKEAVRNASVWDEVVTAFDAYQLDLQTALAGV